MTKVNPGSLHNWVDGEVVTAAEYKQEREIIYTAINGTDDQIANQFTQAQTNALVASTMTAHTTNTAAHPAENISYAGSIPLVTTAKAALDKLKQTIDALSGISTGGGGEVLDARTGADSVDRATLGALLREVHALALVGNYGLTGGAANTYTVSTSGALTSLTDGKSVVIKVHVNNSSTSTINVNGLGAKPIFKGNGNVLPANALKQHSIYTLRYSSTANGGTGAFILQGEGGSGTAQPGDVLASQTFSNDNGDQAGTLVLTGSADDSKVLVGNSYYNTDAKTKRTGSMPFGSGVISSVGWGSGNLSVRVGNGYYAQDFPAAGQTEFTINDPDFVSPNIRAGVNMFGVTGDPAVVNTADATASDAYVLTGRSYYRNGIKGTGTMPNMADLNPNGWGVGISSAVQINAAQGQGLAVKVQPGYYDGANAWTFVADADLSFKNVKAGINLFGVDGQVLPLNIIGPIANQTILPNTSGSTQFLSGSNPQFSEILYMEVIVSFPPECVGKRAIRYKDSNGNFVSFQTPGVYNSGGDLVITDLQNSQFTVQKNIPFGTAMGYTWKMVGKGV